MSRRYSKELLRRIRNQVDIREVIRTLDLPWKTSEGYFRFLCPRCSEFNTATHPRTNLGRCFRCRRNFNPIDLVMAVRASSFTEAVGFLRHLLPAGSTDPVGRPMTLPLQGADDEPRRTSPPR